MLRTFGVHCQTGREDHANSRESSNRSRSISTNKWGGAAMPWCAIKPVSFFAKEESTGKRKTQCYCDQNNTSMLIRPAHANLPNPDGSGKVGFLIVGAQKSATTALHQALGQNREICMASTKEVHFFDNCENFATKRTDYRDYHRSFSPTKESQICGEATPIYMFWDEAPKRIYEYNPSTKIIAILRNPIERAFSHWNMERNRGFEQLPFLEALLQEEERCRESLPAQHRVFSYASRGFYLHQLRRLWMYFRRSNVLTIKYDDFTLDPLSQIASVHKFLGLEPQRTAHPEAAHSWPYKHAMTPSERHYLREKFEHEIRGIESELGWDCKDWLTIP